MKFLLTVFLTLACAVVSAQETAPATKPSDAAAAPEGSEEWAKIPPAKQYTRAEVEKFLDQYVGVWEGDYHISAMQSRGEVNMSANSHYFWELVDGARILKGQHVYATGDQLRNATSKSYFWNGRAVSEVEQDGLKRIFVGQISPEGDSINWSVINSDKTTATATRETFATNDADQPVLRVSGYEEMTKGGQIAYLQLKAELIKAELQ